MEDYSDAIADEDAQIPDSVMAEIGKTLQEILDCEADVKAKKKALDEASKKLDEVKNKTLPDLLKQANDTRVWENSKLALKVTESMKCSLPGPNAKTPETRLRGLRMLDWMRDHGHKHIIQTEARVCMDSTRDYRLLQDIRRAAYERGLSFTDYSTVNHMRFTSWVNQCLKEGVALPSELFKVHPTYKYAIKVKK